MSKKQSSHTISAENSSIRRRLKAKIMAMYGEKCPLTGLPATDLAEVFFWRSDFPYPDRQSILWSEFNCLPVHSTINMDMSSINTERAARVIIQRYGIEAVEGYIKNLGMHSKPRVDPMQVYLQEGFI